MSGKQGLYNRHEEIRLALRYFLQSLHKSKEAGLAADPSKVLFDFARYKGLTPVIDRLSTRPRQVVRRDEDR